jgi:hypothetical protein
MNPKIIIRDETDADVSAITEVMAPHSRRLRSANTPSSSSFRRYAPRRHSRYRSWQNWMAA